MAPQENFCCRKKRGEFPIPSDWRNRIPTINIWIDDRVTITGTEYHAPQSDVLILGLIIH